MAKTEIPLVMAVARVLQTTPSALAKRYGASSRTGTRWNAGRTPLPNMLAAMARDVFTKDKALAARLAIAADTTLEALFPKPSPTAIALADAVVCAAADAMKVAPATVRPALIAALARAKSLGLSLDALQSSLEVNASSN